MPWRICLIAFLPLIFYSSVNVLGCDNGPCEESARLAGFSSVPQYMAVQATGWVLCIGAGYPLTYPILLRMVKFVLSYGAGPVQLVLAFLCCPLAYLYSTICVSLILASLTALVEHYSPVQVWVFLVIIVLLAVQVILLFSTGRKHADSCRCVRRQEAAYDSLLQNEV